MGENVHEQYQQNQQGRSTAPPGVCLSYVTPNAILSITHLRQIRTFLLAKDEMEHDMNGGQQLGEEDDLWGRSKTVMDVTAFDDHPLAAMMGDRSLHEHPFDVCMSFIHEEMNHSSNSGPGTSISPVVRCK
nr:uncharacterized protein LOC107407561 isoform X2 [Ziziphus jujuba var. spinosa]